MAAVTPELDLREPKPKEAPFLYRIQRRIEEYALRADDPACASRADRYCDPRNH